jgi:hypothetical protein
MAYRPEGAVSLAIAYIVMQVLGIMIALQHLGEKAPDFSRGDESPKSLFESRVHK